MAHHTCPHVMPFPVLIMINPTHLNQRLCHTSLLMKLKTVSMAALVSSNGLVNPGTELGDTGVDSRGGSGADTASPGHDTNQIPDSVLLTDQRTTRIALGVTK